MCYSPGCSQKPRRKFSFLFPTTSEIHHVFSAFCLETVFPVKVMQYFFFTRFFQTTTDQKKEQNTRFEIRIPQPQGYLSGVNLRIHTCVHLLYSTPLRHDLFIAHLQQIIPDLIWRLFIIYFRIKKNT